MTGGTTLDECLCLHGHGTHGVELYSDCTNLRRHSLEVWFMLCGIGYRVCASLALGQIIAYERVERVAVHSSFKSMGQRPRNRRATIPRRHYKVGALLFYVV